MKQKKYAIILASFVAIVVELIILFCVLLPSVYLNRVFSSLEKGDSISAQKYIDKLSGNKKEELKEYMADFATYECNGYIKGDLDYKQLSKKLSAINSLDDFNGFAMPYFARANMTELIKVFESGVKEYRVNGYSNKYYDLLTSFSDIYNTSYGNEEVDDILEKNIKNKYDSFLEGEIDYNTIDMYVDVAIEFYIAEPCHFAMGIGDELYYYSLYLKYYDQAKGYFDQEKYFETVVYCNSLSLSENDTSGYVNKITELSAKAYELGKTYYTNKIIEYAKAGNREEANDLLMKIQMLYKDELDYSSLEQMLREPWMYVYVNFIRNLKDNMKEIIDTDKELPKYIYLRDLDRDDIPELMLINDNTMYTFRWDGDTVLYVGQVGKIHFGYTSYLISEAPNIKEGYNGYALLKYEDNNWVVWKYCIVSEDETEYIVNDEIVTKDEWEKVYREIVAYEDKSVILGYDNYLEDYETVIYNYN